MGDSDNSHVDDAAEFKRVLDETFGMWPDFEIPDRDDWDRLDLEGNPIRDTDKSGPPDR